MASAPEVTFQVENWARYYSDPARPDLWAEHYAEIGADKVRMPMSPDVHFFTALDAAGALQVLTARHRGRMVGYFLTVVRPHTHYSSILCGFEDSYFLTACWRKGLTGVRLIKANEAALRARGVKKVFVMTKSFKDLGRLYERLGYVNTDHTYAKWIGDS